MNLDGPILVPLDGSKNSEAAVFPALQLARAYGTALRFLHVVDEESSGAASEAGVSSESFRDYAAKIMGQAGAADVEWSALLEAGDPARTILHNAADARLVAMATHGRGGFHAAFLGSVTDKVVRSVELPVLTVPVQGQVNLMSGPIVVGLDGSTTAEAALEAARDLAPRLSVGIALVRAYSPAPVTGSEYIVYQYDTVSLLKDAAEEYLAATAREGEQTFTAMMGAAAAIQQVAEQLGAGLVGLTSHGRGLAYRLALGSTTDRVIHSIRRPVLVLPAPE